MIVIHTTTPIPSSNVANTTKSVSNPYATTSAATSSKSASTVSKNELQNTIQRVQLALTYAGYYQGSVDGLMGPATRAAISAYKKTKGLSVNEYIDASLLNSLGIKYSQ
jgi:His-Xaa-Ser repeat protein HxsA